MTVPTLVGTPLSRTGGPPLLLGPSLGTTVRLWERAAALLAPRFTLLAWDLPGHGRSPATTHPFSVAELAEGVVAIADRSGFGELYHAGDSLGGQVGLHLALKHPGRVRGLGVICSGAKIGDSRAWQERAATVRAHGMAVMREGSAQRWFAPGFLKKQPDLANLLLDELSTIDAESYALCCEALAASDVRDRLKELETPTIAIYGEHDTVVGMTEAEFITRRVRHGIMLKISGAAHLAPVEQPGAVAASLVDFFMSVTGKDTR
jgi:3-oxoadipate enol-lactonase